MAERVVKNWSELIQTSGTYYREMNALVNEPSPDFLSELAYYQGRTVKQTNTTLNFVVRGGTTTTLRDCFRVVVILSKSYNYWIPIPQPDNYNFPHSALNPPQLTLFESISPVSSVTFDAYPFADILFEKLYFPRQTENTFSDCITIPDFTYLWGHPNDKIPRVNSLWFMCYFTSYSNGQWRQSGASGNQSPGWDLTAEYYLEPSEK